jgi:pyruvate/2-oxoglutarate dehydrogenase complex dihydrolipoamide dehydrogenase (E3) component
MVGTTSMVFFSSEDAKKYGWQIPDGDFHINWDKMKNAIQDHVGSLNWEYKRALREKSVGTLGSYFIRRFDFQVTYHNCYGTFTSSHSMDAVSKKGKVEKLTADRFLISTGLRPRYPDIPGARECCITRYSC